MTAAERGLLLLCCPLGEPDAPVLTMAQFRTLSVRAHAQASRPGDPLRELTARDVQALGYGADAAARIAALLARERQLDEYLAWIRQRGFGAVTRISAAFPPAISEKMGMNAPPVLFTLGDPALFQRRCVALVGSRALHAPGRRFAETAGRLAAEEGYVLVSGGANGADSAAQAACLAAGGSVIVFTAGRLLDCAAHARVLYVSESGCEQPFSTPRAMSRNHLIHAMGEKALVAQCAFGAGGTWHGTLDNLRAGWSPVFVNDDGSDGARALCQRGAQPVKTLTSLEKLQPDQLQFPI